MLLLLFCGVSVCVCSNVCVSFVNSCVVVSVVSGLFVCVCACLFARRVRVVCLRVSVWCCMVCFCVCAVDVCVFFLINAFVRFACDV